MSLRAGPTKLPVPAVCLVILDGWGLAPAGPGNAISLAHTPVFDELWKTYDHTQLSASGPSVGLPEGQMGNSEVGHLNLGAGSVVKQDLVRIDEAVESGALAENDAIVQAFTGGGRVHLIGLVSDGGVHSSDRHLRALIELAAELKVEELVIHAFTDGRDTLPTAGVRYLEQVEEWCRANGRARVGSVVGRYYVMDRDNRWDRIQRAYDLLVAGQAKYEVISAVEAVSAAYARGETDEFVSPTLVDGDARIRPEDSVLAFNFRPDRMREISRALADPGCEEINRRGNPPVERYVTLTEYVEGWPYPVAFRPDRPEITISHVIANHGLKQLHVAETEKYAHVTYFFNGGEETPYSGEKRDLVPSPRDVPTYDHKPEMSAEGVAAAFVADWNAERPAFAIVNFANPDMVGHTGSIPAAVKAIETVDSALGELVSAVHATGGACLVTADHGNADNMLEPDGSPNTAHSTNPVPFLVTVGGVQLDQSGGILADVAPTALELLGIEKPDAMNGKSLVVTAPS